MIRKANDRDIPPADADDTFNDTDIDILLVEKPALLDMQLDKCFELIRRTPCLLYTTPSPRD